jgi:anti-sigma factor RsiW
MNCPLESRNSEILLAYAAGELDLAARAALEDHLAECAHCRAWSAEQAAVWDALNVWEAPPVSPDFDQRLYRRIRQEVQLSWWERWVGPLRPMPVRQAFPLVASACLLLVATIIMRQPVGVAPSTPARATVRVEQVERTLDDLELLNQLSPADHADNPSSEM